MKKEEKILQLLQYLGIHNEKWMMASDIIEHICISQRQLRNYVKELNERHPSLIWSGEKGYWMNLEVYQQATFHTSKYSVDERRRAIMMQLVGMKELNIFELEEIFCCSVPTIEQDLISIRQKFNRYKLSIQRNQALLHICGSEFHIRELLCDLFLSSYNLQFLSNDEYKKICSIVFTYLDYQKISLRNHEFLLFASYLYITKQRIQKAHIITTKTNYTVPNITELWNKLELSDLSFEQQSASYLLNHLQFPSYEIETFLLIEKALSCLCQYYNLHYNDKLLQKLTVCLQHEIYLQQFHSTKANEHPPSSLHSPLCYTIALHLCTAISMKVSYVTLETIMATISANCSFYKKDEIKILYVYEDQLTSPQDFQNRLCNRFKELTFTSIIPWQTYTIEEDVDLLITNVNAVFPQSYLYLSNYLTELDMEKCRQIVEHKIFKKRKHSLDQWITSILNIVQIEAIDVEDAKLQWMRLSSHQSLLPPAEFLYGKVYFPHIFVEEQPFFGIVHLKQPVTIQQQHVTTYPIAGFRTEDVSQYIKHFDDLIIMLNKKNSLIKMGRAICNSSFSEFFHQLTHEYFKQKESLSC